MISIKSKFGGDYRRAGLTWEGWHDCPTYKGFASLIEDLHELTEDQKKAVNLVYSTVDGTNRPISNDSNLRDVLSEGWKTLHVIVENTAEVVEDPCAIADSEDVPKTTSRKKNESKRRKAATKTHVVHKMRQFRDKIINLKREVLVEKLRKECAQSNGRQLEEELEAKKRELQLAQDEAEELKRKLEQERRETSLTIEMLKVKIASSGGQIGIDSCKFCRENMPSVVLLPCLHLCVCEKCFHDRQQTVDECPKCENRVRGNMKIDV